MKQNVKFLFLMTLVITLAACQPATPSLPTLPTAQPNPIPTENSQTDVESTSPLATPVELDSLDQGVVQTNCAGSETEISTNAQAALMAFQETMDSQAVADLQDSIVCWLNTDGDITMLEASLNELLSEMEGQSSFTQIDLSGDGRDDVIALTPAMSMPLLTFIEQNGLYTGFVLSSHLDEPLPTWLRGPTQGQSAEAEQQPFELIDLTGDNQPEIIINYFLPGGSGFSLLPAMYQWQENDFQLIFAAQLINWAGTSSLTFAPDQTAPNRQEIILTYPYLYQHGFDHKLVNHPLGQQIWRWDIATTQFELASEEVDLEKSGWGAGSPSTVEDQLRWLTNEGETAFRAGDYEVALDLYNQVLIEANAENWQPEAEQPNWTAYAAFRRGQTLLLQSQPDSNAPIDLATDGVAALQVVAAEYEADVLGQLAQTLLDGYGDGSEVGAAARAVALMQSVDLYSHFYFVEPGALLFPMNADGILYPGAGLAAYLNARPALVDDPAILQAGLAEVDFTVKAVTVEGEQIQIDLRLPDAPYADSRRLETWTLVQNEREWQVLLPSSNSEPWPIVGGF